MRNASAVEDRLPPQDLTAEQAALGAMLMERAATVRALQIVSQSDFYREAHRLIFAAIVAVAEREEPVDVVTVGAELRKKDKLEEVGGGQYLTRLIGEVPTTAHIIRYATIVKERALARQLVEIGQQVQEELYRDPDSLTETATSVQSALDGIFRQIERVKGRGYMTAREATERIASITWLWEPWLPNGFLTMLAGETGIGKSTLALRIVDSVTSGREWPDGTPNPGQARDALYIDTEGAQAMHMERILAGGLSADRILFPGRDGDLSFSLDKPTARAFVRSVCEERELGIVVIDSLRSGMPGDENSSEFGEKLAPWARLAADLQIPILIVHHANKGRGDRTFSLDRLRGSSAIASLPRSIIAVDKPAGDRSALRVHSVKCNLPRQPEPFGLEIGTDSCRQAPLPEPRRPDQAQANAESFLKEVLADGAIPSKEAQALARDRRISTGTLTRAREALDVEIIRDPDDGRRTLWKLRDRSVDRSWRLES